MFSTSTTQSFHYASRSPCSPCALFTSYTFGKPLVGANITINATSSVSSFQRERNPELLKNISDYQLSDEKGCAVFDLLVSKLGIGIPRIGSGNSITVKVLVEEKGTGLTQAASKGINQKFRFISLQRKDKIQSYLKPNLPYYGRFELKRGDDTPAVNETVEVCYTANYKDRAASSSDKSPKQLPKDILYKAASKFSEKIDAEFGYTPLIWETESPKRRSTKKQCREYLTNEDGHIVYFIPAQAEDIDSLDLETSSEVDGDTDREFDSLRAFFSPSRSYISIDSHLLPPLLPCSGDVTVQLLTSQEGPAPPMVYKILSRGRIIKVGQVSGASLTFPVLTKMGPEFKLLVYYIRENGEVVSDSRIFSVDKCFPNHVRGDTGRVCEDFAVNLKSTKQQHDRVVISMTGKDD
ncbi:murinoglobulin-1-like [Pollicipes pollicipes]|uniref:murinoglobulin-1-like n=1 Tax=Pollicipes pollicipes TaxID=41117 RepID=UPI001884FE1D|nr:murinoglobulin-1-like [Pollicipes pollicipes]